MRKELHKRELIEKDKSRFLRLTAQGVSAAYQVYERHRFLADKLVELGVSEIIAEKDACRMEHCLSVESYEKIKQALSI